MNESKAKIIDCHNCKQQMVIVMDYKRDRVAIFPCSCRPLIYTTTWMEAVLKMMRSRIRDE